MLTSAVLKWNHISLQRQRYKESLIRIAAAVRSQKDPQAVRARHRKQPRISSVDAIAQYDESSNKIHWHMCAGCRKPASAPHEVDKDETLAAWVFQHQEAVTIHSLDRETRFPASTGLMRQAGCVAVGLRRSFEHGAQAARQPGNRQRSAQRLFHRRSSLLFAGGRPDRPGDGRCLQLSGPAAQRAGSGWSCCST